MGGEFRGGDDGRWRRIGGGGGGSSLAGSSSSHAAELLNLMAEWWEFSKEDRQRVGLSNDLHPSIEAKLATPTEGSLTEAFASFLDDEAARDREEALIEAEKAAAREQPTAGVARAGVGAAAIRPSVVCYCRDESIEPSASRRLCLTQKYKFLSSPGVRPMEPQRKEWDVGRAGDRTALRAAGSSVVCYCRDAAALYCLL